MFAVEMAMRKAERLWPKKRRPGDHDRLRPMALAIVDHIELCGMRVFRRPRVGPQHAQHPGRSGEGQFDGGR